MCLISLVSCSEFVRTGVNVNALCMCAHVSCVRVSRGCVRAIAYFVHALPHNHTVCMWAEEYEASATRYGHNHSVALLRYRESR